MSNDLKFVTGIVVVVVVIFAGIFIFGNKNSTNNKFLTYAKQLNLNESQFTSDMDSTSAKNDVIRDRDYATSLNIQSTPTFYVNGKSVSGAQTTDQWNVLYNDAKNNKTQDTTINTSDGQKLGPDTAIVKIVEFADFECPACAAASGPVQEFVKSHSDVQLIFKHFPLPQHKDAESAALASEAAAKQGKFWEMYTLLYDKQSEWATE